MCRSINNVSGPTSSESARTRASRFWLSAGWKTTFTILIALPASIPLAKAVQMIKANSSRFVRQKVSDFEWQKGYGGFSVGASAMDATIEYIRNQKRHHQKRDFRAEFLEFLKRYDVAYDPKYVFD